MKKIPIGTFVHVDGPANQWPFERVVDDGMIIGYDRNEGYNVQLKNHRENLFFRRRDLDIRDNEDKWNNNKFQFARFISECEALGLFSDNTLALLSNEMDLTVDEVCQLIDRAQKEFDDEKAKIFGRTI